jgi:protein TonB
MMVCRPHVTSIPVIPQKQPFRWDVTLTASPKDEPIVAESPELPPPAEPDSPPSATVHAQLEDRGDAHARGPVASLLSAGPTPGGGFQSSMTESAEPDKPSMQVIPAADASAVVPPDVESPRESDRLQVRTDLENPTVVRRPGPINRPVVNRIARQDYTWLMDTLRSRLEQVKVYPPSARANHAQGRVLVQVSIQDDGRIEDVEIEESSGHPILDLAACVALRDASPLALDHEIEGAPVIMVVPLRYQLE